MDSSSNKRVKIFGAVLGAVALVVVGLVVLNNTNNAPAVPLERAQALAKIQNANVPIAQVPNESEVHVPAGWQVESDEPVEGPGSEEEENDDAHLLEENRPEEDEDIDSPMDVEEDENGQKYVAELDENVIADGAEDSMAELDATETAVAEDGVVPRRCRYKLKKCGYRKRCVKRCKKRCKPYAVRKCHAKKYCKCFCKYYGKIKAARRCVIYKRRKCTTALTYKCRRGCKKYCRRVPRCYCCAHTHITQKCKKLCRYISYKTKCGKCRCSIRKCIRKCRFVCKKYRKY